MPVLLDLVAEEAPGVIAHVTDDVIVDKSVSFLFSFLFSLWQCLSLPKETVVTRW